MKILQEIMYFLINEHILQIEISLHPHLYLLFSYELSQMKLLLNSSKKQRSKKSLL